MSPRSVTFAVPAALCALALTAAIAPAAGVDSARVERVVPGVSIHGVQIGMSAAQVRRLLPRRPDRSYTRRHPILTRTLTWTWGKLSVVFDGTKAGRRVISVTTRSGKERTARGVGVGSTEEKVRQQVAGVRCRTELGYRRCVVGTEVRGQIITDFAISKKGRVTRVSLTRVLD